MIKKNIGDYIANRRRKANMTQAKLAEKLNVTKQCVWSWEKSRTQPNDEMLAKMAEALNCQKQELLGDISSGSMAKDIVINNLKVLDRDSLEIVKRYVEIYLMEMKKRDEDEN